MESLGAIGEDVCVAFGYDSNKINVWQIYPDTNETILLGTGYFTGSSGYSNVVYPVSIRLNPEQKVFKQVRYEDALIRGIEVFSGLKFGFYQETGKDQKMRIMMEPMTGFGYKEYGLYVDEFSTGDKTGPLFYMD